MQEILTETPVAAAIFAFTILTSIYAFNNSHIFGKLMLHPHSVSKGKNLYQLISSGFIHKDWGHLFFNMLSFYFFAFSLEKIIGHWQFALLYVISLILSDLPTVAKHKNDYWYSSLGASGAVCAVVFSFILFYPFTSLMIFPIPLPIPAVLYGFLFLAYSSYAARKSNDGINHDAHFYGAIAGVTITIVLYPQVVEHFVSSISGAF